MEHGEGGRGEDRASYFGGRLHLQLEDMVKELSAEIRGLR